MHRAFWGAGNGADGVRTRYLLVANQALSQLSYGPETKVSCRRPFRNFQHPSGLFNNDIAEPG